MQYLPLAGFFLILTVAPCFYSTLTRDVFVLPKTLPLALGTFLIWLSISGKADFRCELSKAISAIVIGNILSALFSSDYSLSILGPHSQQFYALLPMALCVLAYYATANSEIESETLVTMSLLGGIVVSILAAGQGWGEHKFMEWSIQDDRAGSTFGSPIFLGSYLALIAPMAWALTGIPGRRLIGRCVFSLVILGLLACRSRGALLAAALGIMLVHGARRPRAVFAISAFLMGSLLAISFLRHTARAADIMRFEGWKIALMAWRAHPIFGWGPDTFLIAGKQFLTPRYATAAGENIFQFNAHNDILQVLATTGLVGLAAYGFLLFGIIRLVGTRAENPEGLGIAGGVLAVFICAKFNPIPLSTLAMMAVLLGSFDRGNAFKEAQSRFLGYCATAASAMLLFVFSFMCVAERYQRRGEDLRQIGYMLEAAEMFNRAAQVNPFDIYYTQRQLDYFWTAVPLMPPGNQMALAAFSHNISESLGRLHPNDPTAHELRGMSYMFEGEMIGSERLWEADHEFEVAQRLAPLVKAYADRRARVAVLRDRNKKTTRPAS